ncbi:unnamed protein product [Dracunculus medinensis]|uniref:RRM domain-containing protein n=1 Tax=Dracunculus medinensis TaxID=318479 RepID=A0A0N4UGS8_DRAME|nr:unnamed protein product [Dracunculus medinensis]
MSVGLVEKVVVKTNLYSSFATVVFKHSESVAFAVQNLQNMVIKGQRIIMRHFNTIFNESLSLNSEKSMTIGVNDDMKKQHYVNEENWTENLLKNQNEEKGERQCQKGEAQMYNQRNLSDAWYQYRESGGKQSGMNTWQNELLSRSGTDLEQFDNDSLLGEMFDSTQFHMDILKCSLKFLLDED